MLLAGDDGLGYIASCTKELKLMNSPFFFPGQLAGDLELRWDTAWLGGDWFIQWGLTHCWCPISAAGWSTMLLSGGLAGWLASRLQRQHPSLA